MTLIPHKFVTEARVTGGAIATDDRAASQFDVDLLIQKARERAKNPKSLESNPPYFWRDQISSDVIDSYFTRMHSSTLKNFAEGATAGVAFQYSHDWEKLGLGWSLLGHYEKLKIPDGSDGVEPNQRTLTDFYTVPGLRMNDQMTTDDFILGVDSGVLQDVSVGFYAGSIKCGICNGDMFNGWFGVFGKDCNHFPGKVYHDPYIDEKGNAYGGDVLATAWIHDGTLSEVSQVYDGASPGAGHLKAQLYADNNLLDGRSIRDLEAHYRMKLPGGAFVLPVPGTVGVATLDQGALNEMRTLKARTEADDGTVVVAVAAPVEGEETVVTPPASTGDETEDERSMLDDLQGRYTPQGITLAQTARATIEQLVEVVVEQRSTITTLTPEAEDGRTYRKDLVDQALVYGAAAMGEKWDEKRFSAILRSLDLDGVKAMSESWQLIRDVKFPEGRHSSNGDVEVPKAEVSKVRSSSDDRDYRA